MQSSGIFQPTYPIFGNGNGFQNNKVITVSICNMVCVCVWSSTPTIHVQTLYCHIGGFSLLYITCNRWPERARIIPRKPTWYQSRPLPSSCQNPKKSAAATTLPPISPQEIFKRYKRQSLGMPRGTPSSSVKIRSSFKTLYFYCFVYYAFFLERLYFRFQFSFVLFCLLQ
jgi:hypothetical protein